MEIFYKRLPTHSRTIELQCGVFRQPKPVSQLVSCSQANKSEVQCKKWLAKGEHVDRQNRQEAFYQPTLNTHHSPFARQSVYLSAPTERWHFTLMYLHVYMYAGRCVSLYACQCSFVTFLSNQRRVLTVCMYICWCVYMLLCYVDVMRNRVN